MTLVTVKTFDNSMDAHLLKSRIESEGIRCFLFDDETVTINPLFSQAIGGIKIKVNQRDLSVVKEILRDISETPLTHETGERILCPQCQSAKINTGFPLYSRMERFCFWSYWTFLFNVFSFF